MRVFSQTAISILLLFSTAFATPQKSGSFHLIQKRYAEIQQKLKNQQYTIRQISDKRFDDVVIAYFQNNRIELIVSETFGEVGKIRHEYYFGKNGELILASNQLFQYQSDANANADKNLVKVSENSYYYQQKRLVKCVNHNLKVVQADAVSRSRYLLGKSLILTKQIKEQNDDKIIGQYQQNSDLTQFTRRKSAECSSGCD
ncbi:hypothetical protein [Emticicia sp. SJ17W-69]|uniref:hypothetical protein n=1 Tax=Emticicia sp. SJ17W-69 TaxID=3421657 RepID=UPI003EBADCA1